MIDMIDPMISHEYDQQLMVHDRWKFSGKMYSKPKKKDHPQVITILMGGWLLGFPHYSNPEKDAEKYEHTMV